MYTTIDAKSISTKDLHAYMLTAVAPRPIALASTIDKEGNVNVSPFSFFNCFSANPPILIFSPARRVRDNTTKHTLKNVLEVPEVVINIVNYSIVQQMSLSSTEYGDGVNEFVKAGFTEVPSETIKPPRVGESPVAFECKVNEVISMGNEGGAGNLVICEVQKIHIKSEMLDADGTLSTQKLDLVGRMGGMWYTHSGTESLFNIPKPLVTKGIGFDCLPQAIRESSILTGNDLALLANVEKLPEIENKEVLKSEQNHKEAQQLLAKMKVEEAWNKLTK